VELKKTTKDVKLQNIQYKILHNIYPTMKHLHTWKIKESPNCSHCNVQEDLKHAIYLCPIAMDCWDKLKTLIGGYIQDLSYKDILIGTSAGNDRMNLSKSMKFALDTIIILLKQRLILQREEKRHLTIIEISNVIDNLLKIDKYIAIKNKNMSKYNAKYNWLETIVNQP